MIYVEIVTAVTPANNMPGRSFELGCFVIHSAHSKPSFIAKTPSALTAQYAAFKAAEEQNEEIIFFAGKFEDMLIEISGQEDNSQFTCSNKITFTELQKFVQLKSGREGHVY